MRFTTCPPPPPPPPGECGPVRRDLCDKDKPETFLFEYVGGSGVTNSQEGDATASGSSGGVASLITGVTGSVAIGTEIEIENQGKFTYITIVSEQGTQVIEIHSSCSKDMFVGDRFGGLLLIGFDGDRYTTCEAPPPPPPPPPGECSVDFSNICEGDKKQKPTLLIFQYVGGVGVTNNQDRKATVSLS